MVARLEQLDRQHDGQLPKIINADQSKGVEALKEELDSSTCNSLPLSRPSCLVRRRFF
jgi:hypothetical protein